MPDRRLLSLQNTFLYPIPFPRRIGDRVQDCRSLPREERRWTLLSLKTLPGFLQGDELRLPGLNLPSSFLEHASVPVGRLWLGGFATERVPERFHGPQPLCRVHLLDFGNAHTIYNTLSGQLLKLYFSAKRRS